MPEIERFRTNREILVDLLDVVFGDSFMKPEIDESGYYEIEAKDGSTVFYPRRFFGPAEIAKQHEVNIRSVVPVYGACARLSAPGYLDSTDWSGFASVEEAARYLVDEYGDDEIVLAAFEKDPLAESALSGNSLPETDPVAAMASAMEAFLAGEGDRESLSKSLAGYRNCLEKKPHVVLTVTGTDSVSFLRDVAGRIVSGKRYRAMDDEGKKEYVHLKDGFYVEREIVDEEILTENDIDNEVSVNRTSFATRAEAAAFADGVDEGAGWGECEDLKSLMDDQDGVDAVVAWKFGD